MAADRLMLVQALEAVRCLDEGVLRSKADGEIGAIFGLGFAPNTGGPFAWFDRFGVASAVTILTSSRRNLANVTRRVKV